MENKLKATWKTDGKELPADYKPGSFVAQDAIDITVMETPLSFNIDPDDPNPKPAGIPISAKLGVALIADFQHQLDSKDTGELVDMLKRSSAITIDKNTLLKTISQPGCEGIRFYPCKKIVELSDGTKQAFISLVTVGVDINGKDLHYNFDKTLLEKGLAGSDLKNTSLVGEYNQPPPYNKASSTQTFDEKYVLLQYAMQQESNIKTQNF